MSASSTPLRLTGVPDSMGFSTGIAGFLNGDSVTGAALTSGESTRGASPRSGAWLISDSGDSLNFRCRAALISLSEADS